MNQNTSSISIIGKKIYVGFTGLLLLGFIIGHLLGNFTYFVGQNAINDYAYFLHHNPALIYSARVVLLFSLITHVYFSVSLAYINKNARQTPYLIKKNIYSTFASNTMIYSGIFILIFIVYHLLHFTLGIINPDFHNLLDEKGRIDVYSMVRNNFQNGFISAFYVFSLINLGLHLSHAFFSVCQTLSILSARKTIHKFHNLGQVLGIVIALGYISIPLLTFIDLI
jgi:succinate dehydrogenase / fumarate reductase cytochrome b subunit